jgi:nitrogen fixation protein
MSQNRFSRMHGEGIQLRLADLPSAPELPTVVQAENVLNG